MLEALDTELGRLLAGIDPAVLAETIVFVVGDNGTAAQATTPPFDPDHAKNTVFEGGINVPFFVSGPGIPAGAECEGLVNLTDLLATVAELTGGGPVTAEDSVSIVPYFSDPTQASLRPWIYSERMESPIAGFQCSFKAKVSHPHLGDQDNVLSLHDAVLDGLSKRSADGRFCVIHRSTVKQPIPLQ